MNRAAQAYSTSTVTAVPLALGGAVLAVVWALCLAAGGARVWPVLALASLAVLAAAGHLAVVRLTVGADLLFIGLGPWGRTGRRIPRAAVRSVEPVRLTGAQAYGFGLRWVRAGLSRYTVRGGDAVHLVLAGGEQVYVTVPDAARAAGVLRTPPAGSGVEQPALAAPRPWFGPKRLGFGLRPQTWQGWLVTLVPAVLVVAVAVAVAHP